MPRAKPLLTKTLLDSTRASKAPAIGAIGSSQRSKDLAIVNSFSVSCVSNYEGICMKCCLFAVYLIINVFILSNVKM